MRKYEEKKINPIDFKLNTAVGLAFPFVDDGITFFKLNYTTVDQIKDNLKNLLLTNKGERHMLPDFGTNLKKYLFENIGNIDSDDVKSDIEDAVRTWMPSVKIKSIDITQSIDEYKYRITLKYIIRYTLDDNTLVIDLNL